MEDVDFGGTGAADLGEPPCRWWELNPILCKNSSFNLSTEVTLSHLSSPACGIFLANNDEHLQLPWVDASVSALLVIYDHCWPSFPNSL